MHTNFLRAAGQGRQLIDERSPDYITATVAVGVVVLLAIAVGIKIWCFPRNQRNVEAVNNNSHSLAQNSNALYNTDATRDSHNPLNQVRDSDEEEGRTERLETVSLNSHK